MSILNRFFFIALCTPFFCLANQEIPNNGRAVVKVNISATIIMPTCDITGENNETTLFSRFNNIDFSQVEAQTAYNDILLKYNCEGGEAPMDKILNVYLYPTKYGVYSAMGNHVLQTSQPGLGIALTKDNVELDLYTWVPFGSHTANGQFILRAMLVTPDTLLLREDNFDSSVAVVISYL